MHAPKKILIVDDSKSARREIARLAHPLGLTVFEAENGRYGLEFARSHSDIALVFCDVNMPEVNGLEFLAAFRKQPAHATTSVILMSREVNEEVLKQARTFKIHEFIRKPLGSDAINAYLAKFCA